MFRQYIMSNSKLDKTKMDYSEYYRKLQQEKAAEAQAVRDARVRHDDKQTGYYSRGYEPYLNSLLKTSGDSKNPVLESREAIYKKRLDMYLDLSNKKKIVNDAHYQDKQNETYLGALKSKSGNNLDNIVLKLSEQSPANEAITRTKLIENFKMMQLSATDAQQIVTALTNAEVYVMYNYWDDFVNTVVRTLSSAPTLTLLARYIKKYIEDKLDDLDDSTRASLIASSTQSSSVPSFITANSGNVSSITGDFSDGNTSSSSSSKRSKEGTSGSKSFGYSVYDDNNVVSNLPVETNPLKEKRREEVTAQVQDLKKSFTSKANREEDEDFYDDEKAASTSVKSDPLKADYQLTLESIREDSRTFTAEFLASQIQKLKLKREDYRRLELLDDQFVYLKRYNKENQVRIIAYATVVKGENPQLYTSSSESDADEQTTELKARYKEQLQRLSNVTMTTKNLKQQIEIFNPPDDIIFQLKIVDKTVRTASTSWKTAKLPLLEKVYALCLAMNNSNSPSRPPPPPPPRMVRTVTMDEEEPARKQPPPPPPRKQPPPPPPKKQPPPPPPRKQPPPPPPRKQPPPPPPKKQPPPPPVKKESLGDLMKEKMKARRALISDDSEVEGNGLKSKKKGNNIRLVIGKGATLKHDVDLKKLENDILSVRYKNNSNGYKVKPVKISPECKTVIMGIAMNETLNEDIFESLQPKEKRLVEHYVHQMKIPIQLDKKNLSDLGERFEVLKGELRSGNNNPQLKKMLKEVTNELYYFGYISKTLYESILEKYC